jgi:hypothetical protein
MTKEKVVQNGKCGASEWRTADPSPPLRSSRDDKQERVVEREKAVVGGGTPFESTTCL